MTPMETLAFHCRLSGHRVDLRPRQEREHDRSHPGQEGHNVGLGNVRFDAWQVPGQGAHHDFHKGHGHGDAHADQGGQKRHADPDGRSVVHVHDSSWQAVAWEEAS
jgi:hypothetical protein